MIDYSVINNVNVFVRLSGFIHPTFPCVLLESSTRTALTLDHFLVFSGRQPPLRSDHATVRAYDHICRILLKQQPEIDVSGSRCLATTMRLSRKQGNSLDNTKNFISQESKILGYHFQCSSIGSQFRLTWSSIFGVYILLTKDNGNDGGDIVFGKFFTRVAMCRLFGGCLEVVA